MALSSAFPAPSAARGILPAEPRAPRQIPRLNSSTLKICLAKPQNRENVDSILVRTPTSAERTTLNQALLGGTLATSSPAFEPNRDRSQFRTFMLLRWSVSSTQPVAPARLTLRAVPVSSSPPRKNR